MTFQKLAIPGLETSQESTLNGLLKTLDDKYKRNHLRSCYYDGKHAVRAVGTIIPPQYYKLGIVLGWSAKAVDVLARRCNLDGFVWPDGDLASLGLPEVMESNRLGAEINSAIVQALQHGASFLINTQGAEGEPKSLIHIKDAKNATGEWDPRRRVLKNLVSVNERDDKGQPISLVLYLPDLTLSIDKADGKWTVVPSEHAWGVPAEPLVYKYRTARPFGSSRISRPVMSLQDQATRTVIRMEAHNDVYTIPDLWMLGADEAIFKNADGTQKASWQVVMGRIKAIPDDDEATAGNERADVKQFPASSPEPHIASLKQQAQLFSGETSIPISSLGVSDMSNPTSADSYIASREDLIAEAEGTTDDFGPTLGRTITRALAIQNGETEIPREWATIAAKWRSPIYLSRAAAADAGSKQLSAAPWLADTEVGLELLGLSEQQIARAMADRRRAAGRQVIASLTPAADANTV